MKDTVLRLGNVSAGVTDTLDYTEVQCIQMSLLLCEFALPSVREFYPCCPMAGHRPVKGKSSSIRAVVDQQVLGAPPPP